MNRRVTSTHIPYLPITVEIPEQKLTAEFNALVDTGFSGEIVVPHTAVSDNTAAIVPVRKPPAGTGRGPGVARSEPNMAARTSRRAKDFLAVVNRLAPPASVPDRRRHRTAASRSAVLRRNWHRGCTRARRTGEPPRGNVTL
jgi:hypothetical protein